MTFARFMELAIERLPNAGRDEADSAFLTGVFSLIDVVFGADIEEALDDGRAYGTWRRMIEAQGGDPDAALPVARETHTVTAPATGVLLRQDALAFGIAAWRLGAGRARVDR